MDDGVATYDITTSTIPVKYIMVKDDGTCDENVNADELGDLGDNIKTTATMTDRTPPAHSTIVGDNDNAFYYLLLSMTNPDGASETCTAVSGGDFINEVWT